MMNTTQADYQPEANQAGQDTSPLRNMLEQINLAENLDEETLKDISKQVYDGFMYDMKTREDWEQCLEEWTKLALQTKEKKSFPWQDASNVKYPLLSTAAMQFNARAYPSLVPATGELVKVESIGYDKSALKLEKAKRISKFMSYQLLHEMGGWEEDMDKLLIMLPIVGTMFKKTYWDKTLDRAVSELILPKDIVIDFWAKNIEDAERVSQILYLNKRQIKEKQLAKIFRDVDLGEPQVPEDIEKNHEIVVDATLPYRIVEQHTYYDLDKDDYAEPYVITFDLKSKEILRITPRFDEECIKLDEEGNLVQVVPLQYYTKFGFIPNPNGGFYDIGFGLLLSPINESVNTLINQLIDSGTLSNLQGGFLGKGLKLKMGEQQWSPGEWKTVQTTADDIRKQIFPLPTKEPSKVLFELMGTLVTSGKELASVAEIFVGKMPGQNTPATTTMATIEQGMKVFTAVYKRIYRALKLEYKKLFTLNRLNLDLEKYQGVLDVPATLDDFDEKVYDVCPTADPSTPTQTEKLMKAQALLELLPLGILDPLAVVTRVLDAQEQPNVEQLFNQQIQQTGQFTPPPDPKLQEMEMKGNLEQQKVKMKMAETQQKMELNARDKQVQLAMKQQEHAMDMKSKQEQALIDGAIAVHKQKIFSVTEQQKQNQMMSQSEASHQQSMRQQKEKQSLQKKQTNSTSGKRTPSQRK